MDGGAVHILVSNPGLLVLKWLCPGFSPLTCLFQFDQAEGFERKRLNDCGRSSMVGQHQVQGTAVKP
jgi:hypothetical protein